MLVEAIIDQSKAIEVGLAAASDAQASGASDEEIEKWAEAAVKEWAAAGVDLSALAAGLAAAAAGGSANVAANSAEIAVENNFIPLVAVLVGVIVTRYVMSEGDGNFYEGLRTIGRGEDLASQLIATGTQEAVKFSLEHFPESTENVLNVLIATGEIASATFEYIDDAKGNVVSTTWDKIPEHAQEAMLGGTAVVSIILPAGTAGKVGTGLKNIGRGPKRTFDFTTNGAGNDLRRFTTLDGTDVRINSGHAYNRTHAGGDVSQIGTMDEIENAILRDISANSRLGNLQPRTTQTHTVQVNGQTVGYSLAETPVGANINYYPVIE